MKKINSQILNQTSDKAKLSDRKRMNLNYHHKADALMQRMLNAVNIGTYIQPHKHENPDKVEVFLVLRGRIAVVEFDDFGNITDYIILDSNIGNYGAEIAPRTWHTIISLEDDSVAYEIKNGPYNQAQDKDFASWAPKEGDSNTDEFINKILSQLEYI